MKYITNCAQAHSDAEQIFRSLLPRRGMAVREGQIALCHEMLDTLYNKETTLCDAGVGIGKTLAYLVACILWQAGRPTALERPVVISTASVTLQDAILEDYLPFLSRVLLDGGFLAQPVRAVIRKGKERFACDLRLDERIGQVVRRGPKYAAELASLRRAKGCVDLDRIPGLSHFDRVRICVPPRCPPDCPERGKCRYLRYLADAKSGDVMIQICNHNFLLADAAHRRAEWPRLLKDYRALVVDEAHKLPDAARQMYTQTLSRGDLDALCVQLEQEHHPRPARRLREVLDKLDRAFTPGDAAHALCETAAFIPAAAQTAALETAVRALRQSARDHAADLPRWLTHRLEEAGGILTLFTENQPDQVLYLQHKTDDGQTFCAAPRDIPALLGHALWRAGTPAILTSGTLMTGGSFGYTRQVMGLAGGGDVREFRAESPFHYRENCLLYLPERPKAEPGTPLSDAARIAGQLNALIRATHGHTLVLFTSYRQMSEVGALLRPSCPVPLLEVWRGGQQVIRAFRALDNGVLLAAGPCWEGVDFPGDRVSSLVVVRLPFPVPDPVREAERSRYSSLDDYIAAAIVPEMQRKLRQGFGRAIRTETDSCAVAILDPRAAPGGRYHRAVLDALPAGIPVTTEIEEIQTFLRAHKGPEYFLPRRGTPEQNHQEEHKPEEPS